MAVTRIKNNQITDSTITGAKIANTTLTGGLFASSLTLNSEVSIVGNLSVTGATSTVSSTNTFINDPLVVYNNGYTGDLSNYSIGMLVNRNLASLAALGSVNVAWAWDEAEGAFVAIATTDTGSGITNINNSGYANVKVGYQEVTGKVTAAELKTTLEYVTNSLTTTLVATNFSSGNVDINGGAVDGATIGAASASTGVFTTINADGITATTGNAATWYATTLNSTAGNITTLTAPTIGAIATTTTTINATTGNVTGLTAGSATVSDLTNNRVVIAGTSGALEDDANFTFDGTDLNLTGGLNVTGDLAVDNIAINLNAITSTNTDGDITLTPNGTGEVVISAGLVTTLNAATATIPALNSTAGNITTLTSPTINAIATTSTTVNATTGNITTATAGSMAVSDLTNNRVVIAGTSGELEDDANFTFDGTDLNLTGGLNVTGDLAVDNIAIDGNGITSTDTNGDITITPNGTGEAVISKALVTTLNAATATAVNLNSTAGNITTLTAPTVHAQTTTTTTINATTGNITNLSTDSLTLDALEVPLLDVTAGNITTLSAPNFSSSNVAVTGGFADNVHIGANVAATGTFTSLVATTADINAGTIDATNIGASTPGTGAFTTLDANSLDVDNITIDSNAITSTNTNGDITITPNGTGSVVLDGLSFPQADGSANQAVTTNGSGQLQFTTVMTDVVQDTTPQLGGSLDVNGQSIVSVSNGDINITPNGTGDVVVSTIEVSDLTNNRVVIAGTAGALEDDSNLTYDGTTLATNGLSATTADINGGTIDATVIGGTTPAAVTTSSLVATTADINGGTIDATNIGVSTPGTAAVTTLSASGTSTLAQVDATILNGATLNATAGNVTTLTAPTINAIATTSTTVNATTGNVTTLTATNVINTTLVATNFSSSNVDVNGGAVDGTPIGAASASTGAFTTLSASGNTTVTSSQGSGNASSGALVVTGGAGIGENLNVGGDVIITGDLTVEGDTTTINTATLNVEDLNITIADGAADAAAANGAGITVDGANATLTYANADDSWNFNKLVKATTGSITTLTSTNVINTTLVATNFSSSNVDVNGGAIDGATIGAASASTGAFTTLSASGTSTVAQVDGTVLNGATVNATAGNITTLTSPTINAGTTTSATVNATTGNITTATAGSLAVSDLTNNRVVIAGASGELEDDANFTFDGSDLNLTGGLNVTGDLAVDNIAVNANAITSTNLNGDITVTPNGTGSVVLDGLNYPQADGSAGQALVTDGSAQLSFSTVMTDVVQDTTPQLGGDLDVNGNEIVSVSNGNIALTPNGTGEVIASTIAVSDLTNDRVVFAGVNGALEDSTNLTYDGTNLTTNGLVATTADINGGTIDATVIGGTTPAAVTTSALVATTADINAGTIDGTAIGGASASTAAFTTISASGTSTVAQVDATTVNAAAVNVTAGNITTLTAPTVDAQTTTSTTLNATAGNITTLTAPTIGAIATTSTTVNATTGNVTTLTAGSLAVSDLTNNRLVVVGTSGELEDDANLAWDGSDLDVTGGVNVTGDLAVDNIAINTNAITSTNTNGDISITPNGTGEVVISAGLVTTLNAVTVNPVTLNATTGNVTTLTATDVINTTLVATNFSSSNVDVNGGAVDGTPIGAASASTGAFTTLSASGTSTVAQVDATILNGATVNATAGNITTLTSPTIDAQTTTSTTVNATTGNITTLTAPTVHSATVTSAVVNSTSGNITTLTGTTVNAQTTTSTGVNATNGNVTTLVATNFSSGNVDINGGAIDGTNIGAASAGTGAFTTLGATGVSTLAGRIDATAGTASTSDTTGALVITGTGGAGIGGNINVGGGALLNTDQTANYDVKVYGKTDTSLLWARAASGYDQVLIGNSASVSTLVTGAKLQINTTDSIMLPSGTTAQRPGSVGGTDTAGMIRFNTSIADLEFYDGSAWTTAGSEFTVLASDTFDGDDSTTAFTLGAAATTAGVIASINGVVQLPTTAYSVSGTTLTFTEAPATGDKIEVRRIITTSTVAALESPNGYVQFEAADNGAKIYAGASAATLRWTVNTDGDLIPAGNITQDLGSASASLGAIYAQDATIWGNLTVTGQTASITTTNSTVEDNLIELNSGATSNASDLGLLMERGSTGDNVFMGWDESADRIKFATTTATATATGDLTLTSANIEANYAHVTSTQSLYADLAENYQADATYVAGTVLEFGGAEEVTTATEDSRRVAGIVSTDPAHLMNGGLTGSNVVPLALMGRVPCLAIGPVVKGDMMVSAGFGYAKAHANPATGTVIGKALETLEDGVKATIEVVVGKV